MKRNEFNIETDKLKITLVTHEPERSDMPQVDGLMPRAAQMRRRMPEIAEPTLELAPKNGGGVVVDVFTGQLLQFLMMHGTRGAGCLAAPPYFPTEYIGSPDPMDIC